MDDFTPKYIHIQQYILDLIENGELKPGDKIPSENVLSQQFNVSRVTSNRAIRELYTLGVVERVQGKGTYVIEKSNNSEYSSFMFSNNIHAHISKDHLGQKEHEINKIEIIKPDDDIQELLSLNSSDMVYKITRTVNKDNCVVSIDYSYVPVSLLSAQCDFQKLENTYLHVFLQENMSSTQAVHLGVYVKSRFPNKFESKLLRVDTNTPVLVWDTRICNGNKNVIALTTSVARSENYRPFINFTLD